ncbi:MAG TPA: hypothetical protein VFI42_04545 [Thermomicrobiaceae bacterium]|nr:hypothetical protein [Thermomicrobiaceae bacterium]
MADQTIIDELIASYRELNHRVRGRDFGPPRSDADLANDTTSVMGILFQMRNRELRASQSVKNLLSGGESLGSDETPVDPSEATGAPHTVSILLSQFGTAREATLSQVRDRSDEEWAKVYETPRGSMSLGDYLKTLVDRDRDRMQEIDQAMQKAGV